MPEAPVGAGSARFSYARIASLADLPPRDGATIDVALLDMNAGYANVGHDAIVALVRDATLRQGESLATTGRSVRVLSYAIRDALAVPRHGDGRHRAYLGTGGPGHLDPRRNDAADGTRLIAEDPAWEAPLWRLFDDIAADDDATLYGVCHTFGLLCRWSGAAEPVLRGADKGGPMSGVGTNVLTPEARAHPWFAELARYTPDGLLPVLDSRYYDLIPRAGGLPAGATAIAFESGSPADVPGDALTMLELAREPGGLAPRVFGVNSHPEITSSERVAALLAILLENGTISREVHEQRAAVLPVLRDVRRRERLHVAARVFGDLLERRLAALVAAG